MRVAVLALVAAVVQGTHIPITPTTPAAPPAPTAPPPSPLAPYYYKDILTRLMAVPRVTVYNCANLLAIKLGTMTANYPFDVKKQYDYNAISGTEGAISQLRKIPILNDVNCKKSYPTTKSKEHSTHVNAKHYHAAKGAPLHIGSNQPATKATGGATGTATSATATTSRAWSRLSSPIRVCLAVLGVLTRPVARAPSQWNRVKGERRVCKAAWPGRAWANAWGADRMGRIGIVSLPRICAIS